MLASIISPFMLILCLLFQGLILAHLYDVDEAQDVSEMNQNAPQWTSVRILILSLTLTRLICMRKCLRCGIIGRQGNDLLIFHLQKNEHKHDQLHVNMSQFICHFLSIFLSSSSFFYLVLINPDRCAEESSSCFRICFTNPAF